MLSLNTNISTAAEAPRPVRSFVGIFVYDDTCYNNDTYGYDKYLQHLEHTLQGVVLCFLGFARYFVCRIKDIAYKLYNECRDINIAYAGCYGFQQCLFVEPEWNHCGQCKCNDKVAGCSDSLVVKNYIVPLRSSLFCQLIGNRYNYFIAYQTAYVE